jgi:hypothetical protein
MNLTLAKLIGLATMLAAFVTIAMMLPNILRFSGFLILFVWGCYEVAMNSSNQTEP